MAILILVVVLGSALAIFGLIKLLFSFSRASQRFGLILLVVGLVLINVGLLTASSLQEKVKHQDTLTWCLPIAHSPGTQSHCDCGSFSFSKNIIISSQTTAYCLQLSAVDRSP